MPRPKTQIQKQKQLGIRVGETQIELDKHLEKKKQQLERDKETQIQLDKHLGADRLNNKKKQLERDKEYQMLLDEELESDRLERERMGGRTDGGGMGHGRGVGSNPEVGRGAGSGSGSRAGEGGGSTSNSSSTPNRNSNSSSTPNRTSNSNPTMHTHAKSSGSGPNLNLIPNPRHDLPARPGFREPTRSSTYPSPRSGQGSGSHSGPALKIRGAARDNLAPRWRLTTPPSEGPPWGYEPVTRMGAGTGTRTRTSTSTSIRNSSTAPPVDPAGTSSSVVLPVGDATPATPSPSLPDDARTTAPSTTRANENTTTSSKTGSLAAITTSASAPVDAPAPTATPTTALQDDPSSTSTTTPLGPTNTTASSTPPIENATITTTSPIPAPIDPIVDAPMTSSSILDKPTDSIDPNLDPPTTTSTAPIDPVAPTSVDPTLNPDNVTSNTETATEKRSDEQVVDKNPDSGKHKHPDDQVIDPTLVGMQTPTDGDVVPNSSGLTSRRSPQPSPIHQGKHRQLDDGDDRNDHPEPPLMKASGSLPLASTPRDKQPIADTPLERFHSPLPPSTRTGLERKRIKSDKLDLVWPSDWRIRLEQELGITWTGVNALGVFLSVNGSLTYLNGGSTKASTADKEEMFRRDCRWMKDQMGRNERSEKVGPGLTDEDEDNFEDKRPNKRSKMNDGRYKSTMVQPTFSPSKATTKSSRPSSKSKTNITAITLASQHLADAVRNARARAKDGRLPNDRVATKGTANDNVWLDGGGPLSLQGRAGSQLLGSSVGDLSALDTQLDANFDLDAGPHALVYPSPINNQRTPIDSSKVVWPPKETSRVTLQFVTPLPRITMGDDADGRDGEARRIAFARDGSWQVQNRQADKGGDDNDDVANEDVETDGSGDAAQHEGRSTRRQRQRDKRHGESRSSSNLNHHGQLQTSFESTWLFPISYYHEPSSSPYTSSFPTSPGDPRSGSLSQTVKTSIDIVVHDLPPCLPNKSQAQSLLAEIFWNALTATRPDEVQVHSILRLTDKTEFYKNLSRCRFKNLPVLVDVGEGLPGGASRARMSRHQEGRGEGVVDDEDVSDHATTSFPIDDDNFTGPSTRIEQIDYHARWNPVGSRLTLKRALYDVLRGPYRQSGMRVNVKLDDLDGWMQTRDWMRIAVDGHKETIKVLGERIDYRGGAGTRSQNGDIIDSGSSARPHSITFWPAGSFDYRPPALMGSLITVASGVVLLAAINVGSGLDRQEEDSLWELGLLGPESRVVVPFGQMVILLHLTDSVIIESDWNRLKLAPYFRSAVKAEYDRKSIDHDQLLRSIRMLVDEANNDDGCQPLTVKPLEDIIQLGLNTAPQAKKKAYRDFLRQLGSKARSRGGR